MSLSRTAKYYRKNPRARAVKMVYDKEYQKKESAVKKRVECNKWNRKNGKKGDNIDCSHKNGTIIGEHRSRNRARGGGQRK